MNIIDRIKKHEGYREHLYLDTEGNLTGGWGHHFFVGSYLPHIVAEKLLYHDIYNAQSAYRRITKEEGIVLDRIREDVCVEMIFNLGSDGFRGFRRMISALKKLDYGVAAKEMLKSKWARQVGNRAVTLARIMETGEEDV